MSGIRTGSTFTAIVALSCLLQTVPARVAAAEKAGGSGAAGMPPNIVFILTDDQRFDELGFMNSELQTPNMDALAADGVHFTNAFVTTSLCSPSRASILTGQMMHNHGVIDNNRPLPEGLELFPARLKSAGYETAFVGKWHMGGAAAETRDEFDYWVSFAGQGNYYPSSMAGQPSMLNVNGAAVPQRGYITDELTDYAMQFLEARDAQRPFFLYLSHKAVHASFEPAERHREQYSDGPIHVGGPGESMTGVPMWVQNQRNSWHGAEFPYHSELPLKEFKREYHRTLSAVDDSLGRVRAWLAAQGLADNTVVVLMGDNGFLFGEHGLIDKRNAYEESMRVPLIVAAPGRFSVGTRVSAMVANIDIAPTLLSLAGITPPEHYDGMSFAQIAAGGSTEGWRNEIAYEYYWEFNYPHTPTTFALRSARYKYIQYHGVWDTEELFDLEADPAEASNRIDDPELLEVKIAMRQRLYQALADREGRASVPFSAKFNQGAVFRDRSGSRAAEFPETWLRDGDAWDRLEHIIPDNPNKRAQLEAINRALEAR